MTDWARRYEQLPQSERDDVNQETDRRFRKQTGVARALDPKGDFALRSQWARIRDEVLAQMAGQGALDRRKTGKGLVFWLPAPMRNWALMLLYNYDIADDKPKPEHLKAFDVIRALIWAKVDLTVGVIGHASRTGRDGFDNQGLSDRRAREVDRRLRQIAGGAITFFKAGGTGSKEEVSKEAAYREAGPQLESLDEDERDRSVVLLMQWPPAGVIDSITTVKIEWKKAFDQAAARAGLMIALQFGIAAVSDYGPNIVKGVPFNPISGWPNSWTTGNPDADAIMKQMGTMMINEIEQRARNMKLGLTRDDIAQRYQEWLKDPGNKWVNP